MSKKTQRATKASKAKEEWAEAVFFDATRTHSRSHDLMTVLRALEILRTCEGSLARVAERFNISREMVRSFAAVSTLCPEVQAMCADKRIGSVDVAVKLSALPAREQRIVAQQYASGDLGSKDVRDVVSLRRTMPEMTIQHAIELVKGSRDIKRYLIKVSLGSGRDDLPALRLGLARLLGEDNIVGVKEESGVVTFTITEHGAKRLGGRARERGMTKRQLVDLLSRGK